MPAPVLEKKAIAPEAYAVKNVDREIAVDSNNEKGNASILQSKKHEAPSKDADANQLSSIR